MNAADLLAHYEKVAEADDAIPRLRRFVLDLAVRGKLVPQDPDDEPAAELLKRIAAEKARLVKAGKIRKPRDLSDGEELTPPFEIPGSWGWCRLDTVGAIIGGGTPSASNVENFAEPGDGIPWLTPADLGGYRELYIERGARDLTEKGLSSSSATMMPAGTVLFTSRAPIGYVAIASNPISTNQGFKSIVPYVADCSRFIALTMQTFAPEIDAKAPGTTFKEVSGKIVAGVSFPLPPLAEQKRIVAKVEELMGVCDALEAARQTREEVRERLTKASLARLNRPDPDPATFRRHATQTLATLTPLTETQAQVQALRQTILNLAVRGKLVPQDPNDEPASALLERIAEHRSIERRRRSAFDAVADSECAFSPPEGWIWARFGEVFSIRTGFAFKSSTYTDKGVLVFRVVNFNRDGSFDLSDTKFFPEHLIDKKIEGFLLEEGELLMVMVGGTIGKTTRVTNEILPALLNQNMWRIRSFGRILLNDYELLLLRTMNQEIENLTASTHGHFAMSDYEQKPVCIPPLAEQHRIVAKVDALMALCDRLEASLTATATTRRHLLESLLHQALTPEEAPREAAA